MAEITAGIVKELREKTGAGMMDCKKALTEVNGNLEEAIDWLRKKGLAAAAKKAGRVASEGLVGVFTQGTQAGIVEINAETDFVARNEKFQDFVAQVAKISLDLKTVDELAKANLNGTSVQETLTNLIAVIGENMSLRRMQVLHVNQGVVAPYVHTAITPNLGRIGVLVALESAAPADKLTELGRKIAMHIAATSPQALNRENIDAQVVEREKAIFTEQARASGRPDDVIAKMIDGRIRKFYEEVVLMEQSYVMDPQLKVSQVIENASKEFGTPVVLAGFVRFALGEGIEKAETDFAAEVQATLQ